MCAEVVRDGVRQLMLGVVADGKHAGEVVLGSASFRVVSTQSPDLSDADFALISGDLLVVPTATTTSLVGYEASLGTRELNVRSPVLEMELAQNYPNPFNPSTTIAFALDSEKAASLRVYDVRGALIRTLADKRLGAGIHRLEWDGRDDNGQEVASGVYFVRLTAGSFSDRKKMMLLR